MRTSLENGVDISISTRPSARASVFMFMSLVRLSLAYAYVYILTRPSSSSSLNKENHKLDSLETQSYYNFMPSIDFGDFFLRFFL